VVQVFNRWGNLVFDTKDYQNDWGGTWNKELLPDGVYFYVIDLKDGSELRSGYISVPR
jgi:gliding motility-associated-like protein